MRAPDSRPEIQAVSFDFWFTLFKETREQHNELNTRYLQIISSQYGLPLNRKLHKAWNNNRRHQRKLWKFGIYYSTEDILRSTLNLLDIYPTSSEITTLEDNLAHQSLRITLEPVATYVDSIPILARSYRLAIISDTGISNGKVIKRHLKKQGILGYFEEFVFSDEIKSFKPSPTNFLTLARRLKVLPSEIIHIGDNYRTDVLGAYHSGFGGAIWTNRKPTFKHAERESSEWIDNFKSSAEWH